MAKNYTFTEAVEVIVEGKDTAAIAELGKRFPVLTVKIAKLAAKAGDELLDLARCMPEGLSMIKVNNSIKGKATEDAEEVTGEGPGEDVEDVEDVEAAEDGDTIDLESKTTKELYNMCVKAGIKVPKYGKSKTFYIEALTGGKGKDEGPEDDQEEAEENDYSEMKPQELFKECKKRKIDVEAKKPAKYYINLLKKDDAAKVEDQEDDWGEEGDDWGEEEEAPKKQEKKAPAKGKGKPAAKKKEVEDEGDDWDI